ncbi:hypothetical protein I317_05076 [Kwoniella heveanensis CBS 569]|nr:hypothetical protein I317_05076 [Kwoniella heveanensis CBS 569]
MPTANPTTHHNKSQAEFANDIEHEKHELAHDEIAQLPDGPTEVAIAKPAPTKRLSLFQTCREYKYATLLCFCAAAGILSDGFQIQMSGSIIALTGFTRQFGTLQANGKCKLDPQHVSMWGSLKNVTAMLGGSIGSYPADKIGRRWMILLVQILMIGAAILEQFATKWHHWLGARLIDGLGVGLAQCCINVYVSEMAPTAGRGAILSTVNLGYAIGSFLSSVSLNIVTKQPPEQWRHAVLSQFALSGFAIICWAFLPESARWLCAKGREEECKKVLKKVYGHVPGFEVDEEYLRLRLEIENEQVSAHIKRGGTYFDIVRGTNLRRFIISILPWHWQSAIGGPIIGTYSSYFYQMAGLSNPFLGTVINNSVSIASLVGVLPLIEKAGRRRLLMAAGPICICCLLIMGGVLQKQTSATGPVLIAMACIWQVGNCIGPGALGYVYAAETSTIRLRAKNTGVVVFMCQGLAAVYVYIAPILLNSDAFGLGKTVFFWAGMATLVYLAILYMVPETKGRSYAELDELFERRIPAWKFASTETEEDIQRKEIAAQGTA